MACTPIHPGEVLAEELAELNISATKLARQLRLAEKESGPEIKRLPRRAA